mmetsp:Transcript_35829/g.112418  ORF Transcript_35829/g.112418 Transcript_35829/m.112418 type:complete len:215 (-) Transcript_35829:1547-2191(-)
MISRKPSLASASCSSSAPKMRRSSSRTSRSTTMNMRGTLASPSPMTLCRTSKTPTRSCFKSAPCSRSLASSSLRSADIASSTAPAMTALRMPSFTSAKHSFTSSLISATPRSTPSWPRMRRCTFRCMSRWPRCMSRCTRSNSCKAGSRDAAPPSACEGTRSRRLSNASIALGRLLGTCAQQRSTTPSTRDGGQPGSFSVTTWGRLPSRSAPMIL